VAILSGLPRVRTPATPRATVSPLRTTAAAMPGTSCFWMIGARKPFDVLAEGLVSENSRGNWTRLELFLAAVRSWAPGLRRFFLA
jgi:hypothetical protein